MTAASRDELLDLARTLWDVMDEVREAEEAESNG